MSEDMTVRVSGRVPRRPTLRDAITDALATEDRREWLDPDDVAEMVDDVLACLRGFSDSTAPTKDQP